MTRTFAKAWEQVLRPLLLRPKRVQMAALCLRDRPNGVEVLLITSRDTGRWVLPKGWPMDGLSAASAALTEAWEEAGVTEAEIDPRPIGQYQYMKKLDSGVPQPVDTHVYRVKVGDLAASYPESDERVRRWVTPKEAAGMVQEPGLQDILRSL